MGIVGVVCEYDNSYQPFQKCIDCHEAFGERNCHAPVELLKIMRDNLRGRRGAGWSASTLTGCARAAAMMEVYDYYEPLVSGYNKGRGTWVHAMLESDRDPPKEVIRERRLRKYINVDGEEVPLTGQPDKVYAEQGILMDYKSKDRLPRGPDESHEAQFNVYAWLLDGGTFLNKRGQPTEEIANIKIVKGGMHYLTWNPKAPYKKIGYRRWTEGETEAFIIDRLRPLVAWKRTHTLPTCNRFVQGRWDCDCVRMTKQLVDRGIEVVENHEENKAR